MLHAKDSRERWDAKLIARAYKNPAKYVHQLKRQGFEPRVMLDYSGILLESLDELCKEKSFVNIEVEGEKIGNIIRELKRCLNEHPDCMEFAGTAYSHCYFPTTPEEDWSYQIVEWRNVFKKLFGRNALERVKGFWLPEMAVPGFEDKLEKLIKLILDAGYEWVILPLQSIEGYEQLSLEKRIQAACQPHVLKAKDQKISVIFRIPTYFIDQQSGCSADEVYIQSVKAGKICGIEDKPALIVSASDGENGNVMMNEFFPKTFVPFFKRKVDNKIFSMCVTKFLHRYYEKNGEISPNSEIKIKTLGSSWVSTHRFWVEGTKRSEMIGKIEKLSKKFSELKAFLEDKKLNEQLKNSFEEAKRALLVAETSCYVYWGTEFWFEQGERIIGHANRKIEYIYKSF